MSNIKIAVIGKSAAGKSAFIRSFSSKPESINSVGKGQTTRAYAEYLFLKKFDGEFPLAEAQIASQTEFAETRAAQVMEKFKKEIPDQEHYDTQWISEQLENKIFSSQIRDIILFSDDFFNILEFEFVDETIAAESDQLYQDLIEELNKKTTENEVEKDNDNLLEKLESFYKKVYDMILHAMEEKFSESEVFKKENNLYSFKFTVEDHRKELFSQLLKVDEDSKNSFTGIVNKVRVTSRLNPQYLNLLQDIEFDSITLIDTYGLDHSEGIDKNMLMERYNKIFNKDYPEISTTFLVEALHSGASNDFKNAMITLYEVKPEIMTYIVGTYIDANEKELMAHEDWLYAEDKSAFNPPYLNGKVLQILDGKSNLLATLVRHRITESMAQNRCEVMKKRFAPFCGEITKDKEKIDYEKVNAVSIKSLFLSISDQEHLGDGYIDIDKIICGLNHPDALSEFAKIFIQNAANRFKEIYGLSASRTRWKIRENLENGILGFDGTTIDATWVRVFRDAFNQTFAKEVLIDGTKTTLSTKWNMEGNCKIAFDEVISSLYPYIFKPYCQEADRLRINEINCRICRTERKVINSCGWNIFLNAPTADLFGKRSHYDKVIDWLYALHDFSGQKDADIVPLMEHFLKDSMNEHLISRCRKRNLYIAGKKIKKGLNSYVEIKQEVYNNYKENFDKHIEKSSFFEAINQVLCN